MSSFRNNEEQESKFSALRPSVPTTALFRYEARLRLALSDRGSKVHRRSSD